MNSYTGWQYLLIDVANHYGLDKLTFEDRIQWAEDHLSDLEILADDPSVDRKARPQYLKACMAIRAAQRGEPTGHLVAFDAVCSGAQIMSAATGCVNGARATGLVDPDRRADAYTDVTDVMNVRLTAAGMTGVTVPRKSVKSGVMKGLYGSKAVPKKLFGEDTPELEAFWCACFEVAPGAFTLLNELIETWQPYALAHGWVLPDNFHAYCKVMRVVEKEGIEIDELDHSTFTYQYRVNAGEESGLSNAANVVHSIDAYVLRSLVRRCNYDAPLVDFAQKIVAAELMERAAGNSAQEPQRLLDDSDLKTYAFRYASTQMVEVQIASILGQDTVKGLHTKHLQALSRILSLMLEHEPCPVVTVHDSFATHANHVGTVRYWYKEILAEIADGTILTDLFTQLLGTTGSYQKLSQNLGDTIRQSNYALC